MIKMSIWNVPGTGNFTLLGAATPLLQNLIIDVSKRVPNPQASEVALGRPTVFDTWLYNTPDSAHPGRPMYLNNSFMNPILLIL